MPKVCFFKITFKFILSILNSYQKMLNKLIEIIINQLQLITSKVFCEFSQSDSQDNRSPCDRK